MTTFASWARRRPFRERPTDDVGATATVGDRADEYDLAFGFARIRVVGQTATP